MGTYGRNFEFRVPPVHGQRQGRFAIPSSAAAAIPIGAPVICADGSAPSSGRDLLPVALATGASAPKKGLAGILVYEVNPTAFAGYDPVLTTYSDLDTAPPGAAVQLVSGDAVKVVFRNTVDRLFNNTRAYKGRTMVAGMGATPTLAVGDMLTPGTGSDAAGYWAETATPADAWLIVEHVDVQRQEVEARFVF